MTGQHITFCGRLFNRITDAEKVNLLGHKVDLPANVRRFNISAIDAENAIFRF
jgi:hypothetical protein